MLGLYVLVHMLGNLRGASRTPGPSGAAIDSLRGVAGTVGSPVIPRNGVLSIELIRAVLLAALVIHIIAITQLT